MADGLRRLFPVLDTDRPHGVLGLLWVAVTVAAAVAGVVPLALWFAVVAGLAAVQAAAVVGVGPDRRPVAGVGAALVVLAAAAGWAPFVVSVVAAAVAGGVLSGGRARIALLVAAMGVAGGGPVLARREGLSVALVLLAYAAVHDASTWIMATDASWPWIGPISAAAAMTVLTIGVAAVVAPFDNGQAWVFGVLAVVTAPIGPMLATALVAGNRTRRLPALRRLDGLLVLGPVWAVAAALVL